MKEGVRGCKIQDEIEIVIILIIVDKSLINFDINSIIVMASPCYFSATCMSKMNYASRSRSSSSLPCIYRIKIIPI